MPNKLQLITTDYQILKYISYGMDEEQKMDIYLSKETKSLGKHNYTMADIM